MSTTISEGWNIHGVGGHTTLVTGLDGVADLLAIAAREMAQQEDHVFSRTDSRVVRTMTEAVEALRSMERSQDVIAKVIAVEVERKAEEIVRHDEGRAIVVADGILSVLGDDGEVLAAYAPRSWYAVKRITEGVAGD